MMIVEEIMISKLYTLEKENTIEEAIHVMKENRIKHIPIVDRDMHLIGIVTDRDIKEAIPSIFSLMIIEKFYKNLWNRL